MRKKRYYMLPCFWSSIVVVLHSNLTTKIHTTHMTNTFFSSSRTVLIFSSFLANISLSRSSNENGTTSVFWCASTAWNGIPRCGTGRALICTISGCSTINYITYSLTIRYYNKLWCYNILCQHNSKAHLHQCVCCTVNDQYGFSTDIPLHGYSGKHTGRYRHQYICSHCADKFLVSAVCYCTDTQTPHYGHSSVP